MVARLTAQFIDVAVSGVAAIGVRVEAQYVEVVGTNPATADVNVEAQYIDVAGVDVPYPEDIRFSEQFVEVLRSTIVCTETGQLGVLGSVLAGGENNLQMGALACGGNAYVPELSSVLSTCNAVPGTSLIPGRPLPQAVTAEDTGELGISDSVLGFTHILGNDGVFDSVSIFEETAASVMSLTDAAGAELVLSLGATSAMALTSVASGSLVFTLGATSAMALTSVASGSIVVDLGATSAMALTSTATVMVVFDRSATSAMALSSAASVNVIISPAATSTITVTDSARNSSFDLRLTSANSITSVSDFVLIVPQVFNETASNTLTLAQDQSTTRPSEQPATSALGMTSVSDFVYDVFGRVATSDLDLDTSNPTGGIVGINLYNLQAESPHVLSGDDVFVLGFMDSWTQAARLVDTFLLSASSAMTLTQSAPTPTGQLNYSAESTLVVSQFADTSDVTRHLSNALSMTQAATFDLIKTASSTIVLTSTAISGEVSLFAESPLVFTQSVRPGPTLKMAESPLALVQTARSSIMMLTAENTILVQQDMNALLPYRVSALNQLEGVTEDGFLPPLTVIPGVPFSMEHEATVEIIATHNESHLLIPLQQAVAVHIKASATAHGATTAISLTDEARSNICGVATDALVMAQSANVEKNTTDLSSLIDLVDQADYQFIVGNRAVSSSIDIRQAAAYSLIKDTTECDYTPFLGSGSGTTTQPPADLPAAATPIPGVRFRLRYPAFDAGDAVEVLDLRAPDFGNRERVEVTRIQRDSQGGTLVVFADPQWPKIHTLQMQFSALKTAQARSLLTFLERWVGREIGIYDYEGRAWKGVVTNPNEVVVQNGRESYSATLEIEAVRV
jgi:hypothetical protein